MINSHHGFSINDKMIAELQGIEEKLNSALLQAENIIPPKQLFYHSFKADVIIDEDIFIYPYNKIFNCPICDESYYPEDYYDLEMPIPQYCKSCSKRMDVNQIIKTYGDWAVTLYGIECLTHYYFIHKKRFHENGINWPSHMNDKDWVNIYDFCKAYKFAELFFSSILPLQIDIRPKKHKINVNKNISYKEYLKSNHWIIARQKALKYYGNCCVLCGSNYNINVHHRNYNNLGKEKINKDLIVLCKNCHSNFHGKGI